MSCDFEVLAEGASCRIEMCRGCGCVAVHVGPMSMRLDRAGFAHLASTVRRAHAVLEREEGAVLPAEPGYGDVTRGQA